MLQRVVAVETGFIGAGARRSVFARALCVSLCSALIALGSAHPLRAEMVTTQGVVAAQDAVRARGALATALAREEVRGELARHGVSPEEAIARIAALSDAEVIELEGRVAELAAGGDFLGVTFAILIVTVTVLVITDLLGFTDSFTFIKPLQRGAAKSAYSATARRGTGVASR
jgi:hypothetical protein